MPRKTGHERGQQDTTYRVIFEESTDPKFLIDREGKILDANNAFAELVGKKQEECLGLDVFLFTEDTVAEERRKKTEEAFSTGKRVIFDDRSNGRCFRITLYPIPGEDGSIDKLYVFAQDMTDMLAAEIKSKEQSAFSKEAMEAIPGPFVVLDPQGSIITCNSRFHNVIARNDKDDLSGINTFDLFHPDEREFAHEKLDSILQKGTEESAEMRILFQGGPEFRWFRITTKRIFVDNRIFLVSTGNDIEEYKQKEKELSLSNEQLRFILAKSHTGSWEWEIKSNQNKWSDEIWDLYGIEKNSCTPSYESWKQAIIEEDREITENRVAAAVKKGHSFQLQWRVRHPDGSDHWLMTQGIPIRDSKDNVIEYIGVVIDITGLKEAENKLKENEKRFRNLFEEHSSAMLIIDAETDRIIDANRAATAFYGWPSADICRMEIGQLSANSPEVLDKNKEAASQLNRRKFSAVHKKADGSLKDVEVFCNLTTIAGKKVYYCIVNDVTDRKKAERELIENKTMLEAAL